MQNDFVYALKLSDRKVRQFSFYAPPWHILFQGVKKLSYEQARAAAAEHSLNLEGRSKLSITGVQDVSGFDENTVILTTSQGELCIQGESLHIERIDPDAGQVHINGLVQELKYDEAAPSRSIWSRLFG